MPRGSVAWTARRCGTGCTASMNGAQKGSRTAGRKATGRASRRSSWRSSPRSLKPARSAPFMESCAGAGWTCSRSWPSASASLTTSARSARSSSSSASRTSARVRAIRPRTRRPWRLLKKLRRDAEHSPRRPAEGQADRDLVQDEARIGQKNGLVRQWARRGSRPRQPADQRYESAYLFGAICPARGTGAALAMPYADSEAMQLHLVEISSRVRRGAHAVLLLDRAGWHTTGRLVVPKNITLVFLPSRAPELNPVENIWQYLRQNWLSNRVFETYEAIIEAACDAWRSLLAEPTTITSIGHRGWAHVGQK